MNIRNMHRLLRLDTKVALAIFLVADVLCVGMGMGVPIFCILLGFPLGWYIARRVTVTSESVKEILWRVFVCAIITSAITFIAMAIMWGSFATVLFDPSTDFQRLGIPMILYDPKISFIGWLVLMIFISPFLQLLTTVFASYLTLLSYWQTVKGTD